MIDEINEFFSRCDTLKADIQVVATSRPTGYSNQFTGQFQTLNVMNLDEKKVIEYVDKWTIAKDLNEEKTKNLKNILQECFNDDSIQLLMNTPLQVTILILVIMSGGTPPKQREALFEEYLEVIYKREKVKSKLLIQTEKQLHFGLHRYLGYLLHNRAGSDQNVRSTFDEKEFIKEVKKYLRSKNPFSDEGKLDDLIEQIVLEARERLVLIVEMEPGFFGFELRSIQEFLAASHLVDTAENTTQKFDRFEAISRPSHWRNVALFFAGRVGRLQIGEAANLLEICREVDRHFPDNFIHRGAFLSLELAIDHAFGPNQILQRSSIEIFLSLFKDNNSLRSTFPISESLVRLPPEDVQNHLKPLLENILQKLSDKNFLEYYIDAYTRFFQADEKLKKVLEQILQSEKFQDKLWAIEQFLRINVSSSLLNKHLKSIWDNLTPEDFSNLFSAKCIENHEYVKECLKGISLNQMQIDESINIMCRFLKLTSSRNPLSNLVFLNEKNDQYFYTVCLLKLISILFNEYSDKNKESTEEYFKNSSENKKGKSQESTNLVNLLTNLKKDYISFSSQVDKFFINNNIDLKQEINNSKSPKAQACLWLLLLTKIPYDRNTLNEFFKFYETYKNDKIIMYLFRLWKGKWYNMTNIFFP